MLKEDLSKITVFKLFNLVEGKRDFADPSFKTAYVYEKLKFSINNVLKYINIYQHLSIKQDISE